MSLFGGVDKGFSDLLGGVDKRSVYLVWGGGTGRRRADDAWVDEFGGVYGRLATNAW